VLIAHVYEGLGKKEEVFNWLNRAVTERDGWLVLLNSFPRFESLRSEPEFKDILHRVGLPQHDGK
jgi:hypothetical protein